MDAIEKAHDLKPDLILLDLAMPKMNGVETAAVLRQEFPDVPIVLLTVHENVSRATTAGITAAISKHAGAAAVVECVQRLLKIES
jgi:two-component system vancomycin resistance associated response regulator VraR